MTARAFSRQEKQRKKKEITAHLVQKLRTVCRLQTSSERFFPSGHEGDIARV